MEGFSSESWKKASSNFQDLNKFPPSFLTFFRRGFYFIFSYIRKSFNHFYFFPLNHFLLSLLTFFKTELFQYFSFFQSVFDIFVYFSPGFAVIIFCCLCLNCAFIVLCQKLEAVLFIQFFFDSIKCRMGVANSSGSEKYLSIKILSHQKF